MSATTSRADHEAYRPCVGILLLNRERLVWIGRRADAPDEPEGRGRWWQMPQGGIDAGEDPRSAALRELQEETGIVSAEIIAEVPGWLTYELPAEVVGSSWGGRYRGQRQRWFAARFNGEDSEINIAREGQQQIEFDAWRWARIDELPQLIVPFKRSVYLQVVEAFRHLAT